MNFFAANEPLGLDVLVVLIVCGVLFGSIILIAIIQFIKMLVKHFRKSKNYKKQKGTGAIDYLAIFGGENNILKIETKLQRILIEVVDKSLVNIEFLKQLNIGVQITGNIYKCSSAAMVKELGE